MAAAETVSLLQQPTSDRSQCSETDVRSVSSPQNGEACVPDEGSDGGQPEIDRNAEARAEDKRRVAEALAAIAGLVIASASYWAFSKRTNRKQPLWDHDFPWLIAVFSLVIGACCGSYLTVSFTSFANFWVASQK